jgi:hypothetical protein
MTANRKVHHGRPLRVLPWWAAMIGAAAVTASIVITTLWLLSIAGQNPSLRIEAIKIGLSVGAGTGGAFALLLTFRRQWLSERAQVHAEDVARDNTLDATQRRITELYGKAVEQLGHDKAPVRLGGLYSLERLAQDQPEHRQTVVDVVCAYLRMPLSHDNDAQVRLAAQRLLARHLAVPSEGRPIYDITGLPETHWDDIRIDLAGGVLVDFDFSWCRDCTVDFRGAQFGGTTRFTGGRFNGHALFDKAIFSADTWFDKVLFGSTARFDGAAFNDDAIFGGAIFGGGALFNDAEFGADTWFNKAQFNGGAQFRKARFGGDTEFSESDFTYGTWFHEAKFAGTVTFYKASFSGAADFEAVKFKGNAWFNETRFDAVGATGFRGAQFCADAEFRGAQFAGPVWFEGAQFTQVPIFEDAQAHYASKHTWPTGWHIDRTASDTPMRRLIKDLIEEP